MGVKVIDDAADQNWKVGHSLRRICTPVYFDPELAAAFTPRYSKIHIALNSDKPNTWMH